MIMISVCYLAGEFARTLQTKRPELNITDKEVLCVEIAGLIHDLGIISNFKTMANNLVIG